MFCTGYFPTSYFTPKYFSWDVVITPGGEIVIQAKCGQFNLKAEVNYLYFIGMPLFHSILFKPSPLHITGVASLYAIKPVEDFFSSIATIPDVFYHGSKHE